MPLKLTGTKAVYAYPDGIKIIANERVVNALRDGDVLCKVCCCGLNPVDAKWLYGDKLPKIFKSILHRVLDSTGAGIDFSGIVLKAGPGGIFQPGDQVFGVSPPLNGSLAEQIIVPSDSICYKSEKMSFTEAAVIPLVGLTVIQALREVTYGQKHHCLVIGASGGTGHVAVQVAISKGFRVTAICGRANTEFVKSLGAHDVVNYDGEANVFSSLVDVTLYSHSKFTVVFDTVSSNDPRDFIINYERNFKSRRLLSTDCLYIRLGGSVVDWMKAHLKRFCHIDLFPPSSALFWVRLTTCADDLKLLKDLVDSGSLQVHVSDVFPYTPHGIEEGFCKLLSRRVVGKIAIAIN